MPSVLILCPHRPRRSPSQRYRFEQYLPFLEERGFQFTWSYLLDEHDDKLFYSHGNPVAKARILLKSLFIRNRDVARFKQFDIIFIQREASFLGTSRYERKAMQSGAKVIFDFDDSIWLADTSPGNRKWQWMKTPEKFLENIKYASVVIAGNEYLAAKARTVNRNTVVIPTTIDTEHHKPKPLLRNKPRVIIGWSGSSTTVKHFELLLPVLVKIQEKFINKVAFKVIGDQNYSTPLLDIEAVAWSEDTEVDQLNTLDIGVMPLPDDEWAKGKCGLKGLSYMACEVVAVMSNVGVNSEIIRNCENGFLANDDNDWVEILSRLIEDKELRENIGKAGRQTVLKNYSVAANKEKYLQVFTNL